MILADSFIAFCTLILAVLFWFDVAQMWHIYILLACRSVGSAFHSPSMQASVPLLAPEAQLTRVAGVNQIPTRPKSRTCWSSNRPAEFINRSESAPKNAGEPRR